MRYDASVIVKRVLLEADGKVVEYAAWLQRKGEHGHLISAEPDALVGWLNLISKWSFREC